MNPKKHLCPKDVLKGQKIYLRLPSVEELHFIRTLWSDIETMSPVGGPVAFPENRSIAWFERMVYPGSAANCYCLIFNNQNMPVGEISFHDWTSEKHAARLNVKILALHQGNGYAKDALQVFLSFFFLQVGGVLITDEVAFDNEMGQQLLDSFGFEKDMAISDVCRMVMSKDIFKRLHGEANQLLVAPR